MSHRTAAFIALIGGGILLMARSALGGDVGGSVEGFVVALANAIIKAEGSNQAWNNPGDLTGGDVPQQYQTGVVNSAGVVSISDPTIGRNLLLEKLQRIMNGQSNIYSPDMTITQFAAIYTGGDHGSQWAASVASDLGVSVETTLNQAEASFSGG